MQAFIRIPENAFVREEKISYQSNAIGLRFKGAPMKINSTQQMLKQPVFSPSLPHSLTSLALRSKSTSKKTNSIRKMPNVHRTACAPTFAPSFARTARSFAHLALFPSLTRSLSPFAHDLVGHCEMSHFQEVLTHSVERLLMKGNTCHGRDIIPLIGFL